MGNVDGDSKEVEEIKLEKEGLGYDYVFKRLPQIRWGAWYGLKNHNLSLAFTSYGYFSWRTGFWYVPVQQMLPQ